MNLFDLKEVTTLGIEPSGYDAFNEWIAQREIVPFLQEEATDEHIILYASLPHTFIYSVLIPSLELDKNSIEDLMKWSCNPFSTWGLACSSDKVWIDDPLSSAGSSILGKGEQILFFRNFEGDESNNSYLEINQKIAHVLGLHHVPERDAWCVLDKFGDIEDIIKIFKPSNFQNNQTGKIVTIKKTALSDYTTIQKYNLLRMYDFTRYKSGSFSSWGDNRKSTEFGDNTNIFGNLNIEPDNGSYSRGFQLIDIQKPEEEIIDKVWGRETPKDNIQYASFIAHDLKNKVIAEISCNPSCLANYFTESKLPFEITPVFFKPEVLLKYKADRSKYRLEDRSVTCRGSWYLKTFDVNSAGQVHTYLTYLNDLPYEEQLHWKQYNEKPKAPLSERAVKTDFEGDWFDEYDPLPSLKHKLDKLGNSNPGWWTLRNNDSPQKVHYPYTNSRDEWSEEILNLDQLLIEGLEEKWLRNKAKELGRKPDARLRALKLTEECLIAVGFDNDHAHQIMSPFHLVHNLRSILKGHSWGTEAENTKKTALKEFGNFKKHFEKVCSDCDESLEVIMDAFKDI